MTRSKWLLVCGLALFPCLIFSRSAAAWHDETHIAVAKAAGYRKWFNACGADMAKLKAGPIEAHNHHVNNPPGTRVTPEMVLAQIPRYNQIDEAGHLYGAIVASLRDYVRERQRGKYGDYHLAFCAHYVGDLSQPLHHILYNEFNRKYHHAADGIINEEVLDLPERIRLHPITIRSEMELIEEIAGLANRSFALGCRMEAEGRLLTQEEAYAQISHSASLFRAILDYAARMTIPPSYGEDLRRPGSGPSPQGK